MELGAGIAIAGIWLGYAIAVAAVSFGTKDSGAAVGAAILGALFATMATASVAG